MALIVETPDDTERFERLEYLSERLKRQPAISDGDENVPAPSRGFGGTPS
jgi:hypothetical protein